MMDRDSNQAIKNIVIAGGGSAGWMTAAALAKIIGTSGYSIKLIESEEIGTISVGEATIPNIRQFNAMIGIDENDFLKYTQGTFKLGIEFVDWRKKGHAYMHPFGPYGANMMGVPFHHFWLKNLQSGGEDDLLSYCLEGAAAKKNKFTRPLNIPNSPLASINYAFHFDATLYAKYLRVYSEALGVKRIEGKIEEVKQDSKNGFIQRLVLTDGTVIEGDLFIDCTGFRGLLIEQTLNTGFEDWGHWLPSNSAAAQASIVEGEMKPYTVSTAHQSGWQWQIPLQSRIGNGHVYSREHLSDDEAISNLQQNMPGEAQGEPRLLKWKNGRRKKAWNKNCIAIGLSAGFLEPLESTGLHLIQSAISRLLSLFPDKSFRQADIDAYNQFSNFDIEKVRDFIILHYKITERDDSPFWNYCRNMEIPESLQTKIALYRSHGRVFRDGNELFNELSWLSVLHGQGVEAEGYHPLVDNMPEQEMKMQLARMQQIIKQCLNQIPSHNEYIQRNCSA